AQREPLCEAAVVDEADRRAVLADELEERGVDRRPDRVVADLEPGGDAGAAVRVLPLVERRVRAELAHVLERHRDLQVELLRDAGVDELDRAAARDEAADLL